MLKGDIVLNKSAGNKNPNRVLMYIGTDAKFIKCLSAQGKMVRFHTDASLKVIGHNCIFEGLKALAKGYMEVEE